MKKLILAICILGLYSCAPNVEVNEEVTTDSIVEVEDSIVAVEDITVLEDSIVE
jgi:hypothetical protein